jgi:hypothetical protein
MGEEGAVGGRKNESEEAEHYRKKEGKEIGGRRMM